jgi:threonyl-tRNA synthetase
MLHRVLLGSLERFIGALLEHYAGALPVWLAPVQTIIIPLKAEFAGYAAKIKTELERHSFRVQLDTRNETLDKRIREAELDKIPYIVVVGTREAQENKVAVRKKGSASVATMPLSDFAAELKKQIANRQ